MASFQETINLSGGKYSLAEYAYALLLCSKGMAADAEQAVRYALESGEHKPIGKRSWEPSSCTSGARTMRKKAPVKHCHSTLTSRTDTWCLPRFMVCETTMPLKFGISICLSTSNPQALAPVPSAKSAASLRDSPPPWVLSPESPSHSRSLV
jgi:hypothetical protein